MCNVEDLSILQYVAVTLKGLDSVVTVDDVEVVKQAETTRADQPVVDAVISCIAGGYTKKMKLVKEAALQANVSHRDLMAVLDRYTGTDPATARWTCTVGQRGAKIYSLMTAETSA